MPIPLAPETMQLAIDLSQQAPQRPALDILDQAMRQCHCDGPAPLAPVDFDPPSPFAELLRQAFAPTMDPRELRLLTQAGQTDAAELQALVEAARRRWYEVIDCFANRYRLWTP